MKTLVCGLAVLMAACASAVAQGNDGTALAPRGDADMTAALMGAVDRARAAGGGEIRLAPGTYHFRSPLALRFYVSNHDNPMPRNVFLPITNVTDLALACDGRAEFVFHGEGIGIGLQDTKNVKLRGIGVDWDRPYFNEVTVEEIGADGRVVISADPRQFPLELDGKGCLVSVGEGWRKDPHLFEVFDGVRLSRTGGTWFDGKAEALGGNRFRLKHDMSKVRFVSPLRKGDFATMRSGWRPNPAVHLYRADDTVLEDCVVHSSAGMGLIAQRCANVTVRGTGKPLDRRAGSFARACTGRRLSLQADATHFSNCKGLVTVENCLFEGMNDDAINVHSTCLQIESVTSPFSIRCRYRHKQSVGFEVFRPGERMRCIRGRTLEPSDELIEITEVDQPEPDVVDLSFEGGLPDGIGIGDAVENADWQPAVVFRGNVVRNSSPRATLFTTPGKVVCEDNVFEHISAQAVHLSADAWDWYESGACRDVTIRNNVFRDVRILGGKAVIQIDPNVKDLPAQKARYHRNIVIENNVFEQDKGPLLYARSVSNLVWRANTVVGKAMGFDVEHCEDVTGLQDCTASVPAPPPVVKDFEIRRNPALEGRKAFFYIDDVIWLFRDLTRQRPKSLFDNAFLRLLREAHERYGMKIQLNCFYRTDFFYGTDEFTLAEMTDAYRDEWQANKGWLRLGFHSLQEFPDYPFVNLDYADARKVIGGIAREVRRFAGEGVFARGAVTHWGVASKDTCRAAADEGIRILIAHCGPRRAWDGKEDALPYGHAWRLLNNRKPETALFTRYGAGEDIASSISGYNHFTMETGWRMFGKFDYAYDRETKIGLKELEDLQQIGAINIYEVAELPKMFKKVIGNEFITFGDHEQYFHKDYFHYQSDYAEKIFTCGKLLQDAGYEFFFLEELAADD